MLLKKKGKVIFTIILYYRKKNPQKLSLAFFLQYYSTLYSSNITLYKIYMGVCVAQIMQVFVQVSSFQCINTFLSGRKAPTDV